MDTDTKPLPPALDRAKRARALRIAWRDEERRAILAARDRGHTGKEIGKALGISHQAVFSIARGAEDAC